MEHDEMASALAAAQMGHRRKLTIANCVVTGMNSLRCKVEALRGMLEREKVGSVALE